MNNKYKNNAKKRTHIPDNRKIIGTATRQADRSLMGPGFMLQALDFESDSRRRLPPRATNNTSLNNNDSRLKATKNT